MYKAIGAVILFLSALGFALYRIYGEKKHIRLLRGFSVLLGDIYRQIDLLNLPVAEILKGADKSFLSLCGANPAEEIDLATLCALCEDRLDKNESEIITAFASCLGRSYRDEQLRLCKYYSEELDTCLSLRETEYPKKRKLMLTLSLCLALGIIILII